VLVVALAATGFASTATTERSMEQQAGHLYANHDLAGATEVLRRGVREHPDSAQLHFMLGNALMRSSDWRAAIAEYQNSARLNSNHPDTYLNLGYAYYHISEPRQAVQAWETAARQSPNDALIHATLAIGLLKAGAREEAIGEIARARRLDPGAFWRKTAEVDFRWDQRMRADADQLLSYKQPTPEHSQRDLAEERGESIE